MVTVKQLKEAGFKTADGDITGFNSIDILNANGDVGSVAYIVELDWRKNTGAQPVGDDCVIEVKCSDGFQITGIAGAFDWNDININFWRPYINPIFGVNKITYNQETKTALEMSERDIENYADASEWVNGDSVVFDMDCSGVFVGYLPKNKDMCVVHQSDFNRIYSVKVSELSKPETPEQKAARERDKEIKSLMKKWGHEDYEMNKEGIVYTVIEKMLDEGYRK